MPKGRRIRLGRDGMDCVYPAEHAYDCAFSLSCRVHRSSCGSSRNTVAESRGRRNAEFRAKSYPSGRVTQPTTPRRAKYIRIFRRSLS